jgi:hypothetical protein
VSAVVLELLVAVQALMNGLAGLEILYSWFHRVIRCGNSCHDVLWNILIAGFSVLEYSNKNMFGVQTKRWIRIGSDSLKYTSKGGDSRNSDKNWRGWSYRCSRDRRIRRAVAEAGVS